LNDFGADGNVIRTGPNPKPSDLEVVSLTLTSEYMSIDSENLLFKKLNSCHRQDFPQLIDRSKFNRREKDLFHYIDKIRAALAQHFVASEQYFIVDSMPIEICKLSREKRAQICKETLQTAPDKGYCASQQMYCYDYKLHGVCSVNGSFYRFDQGQRT